jgi:protein tyrosine phosphatase (PTP) superfamily phosphohydrolase (DUF442 family)
VLPTSIVQGLLPHNAVQLCGVLSAQEQAAVIETSIFKSWLYINPAAKAEEMGLPAAAAAANIEFKCAPVMPTSLTKELAAESVASLDALPKPCLIQCSTATRAGTVLLLSLAKQRGLNFAAAMQLAVDLKLNLASFKGVYAHGEAPANPLVQWVKDVTADNELVVAAPGLAVKQLFDPTSSTYTYLLSDTATGDAILIDPVLEQVERDLAAVDAAKLTLKYVVNTHAHADHVTGSGKIKVCCSRALKLFLFRSRASAHTILNSRSIWKVMVLWRCSCYVPRAQSFFLRLFISRTIDSVCSIRCLFVFLLQALRPGAQSVIGALSGADADLKVNDGDSVSFGGQSLKVLATPGRCASVLL